MRRVIALPILALALLAGCAVGPDYKPPGPPAGSAAPLVSVTAGVEATAEPPDAWWRLDEDPLLDRLVRPIAWTPGTRAAAEVLPWMRTDVLTGSPSAITPTSEFMR